MRITSRSQLTPNGVFCAPMIPAMIIYTDKRFWAAHTENSMKITFRWQGRVFTVTDTLFS